jgi:hypothetical protein
LIRKSWNQLVSAAKVQSPIECLENLVEVKVTFSLLVSVNDGT